MCIIAAITLLVSTFVLLPPPCIKTTISAQISGKVKCTSCVKKTVWKVGEEQKVKKVKEKRKRRKIGRRSTCKDQEEGAVSFKPSASGKF